MPALMPLSSLSGGRPAKAPIVIDLTNDSDSGEDRTAPPLAGAPSINGTAKRAVALRPSAAALKNEPESRPQAPDSAEKAWDAVAIARANPSTSAAKANLDTEPPRKRPRLADVEWDNEVEVPGYVTQKLHECLQLQLFPHVNRALAALNPQEVDVNRIGSKVRSFRQYADNARHDFAELCKVVKRLTGRDFTSEFRQLDGRISAATEAELAKKAASWVIQKSKQLKYRYQPGGLLPRPAAPPAVPSLSSPVTTDRHTSKVRHVSLSPEVISSSDTSHLPRTPARKPAGSSAVAERLPLLHTPAVTRPAATKDKNHQLGPTSPVNYRTRAHALTWRKASSRPQNQHLGWFSSGKRPYLSSAQRNEVVKGSRKLLRLDGDTLKEPLAIHVDFVPAEVEILRRLSRQVLGLATDYTRTAERDLTRIAKKYQATIVSNIQYRIGRELPGRDKEDVARFLEDLLHRSTTKEPKVLSLERDDKDLYGDLARGGRTHSLLLAREIAGSNGSTMRELTNFKNEFRKVREDGLELQIEWTNCAGDIATAVWVSNDAFICGTTEHSDSHNQQYNKPGNLVLGSPNSGVLRAYPDHRIVRPVVEKGENALEEMRQSQDPWLYSSVVASDYDARHDRAYTSGFDRTVKTWKVDPSGSSMSLLGTWHCGGNVNFVAASKHPSGLVATAADVPNAAVRVYKVDPQNIGGSSYRSYSCSRVDSEGKIIVMDKWAYFPATMQWGLAEEVNNLLLVGYSPRSLTVDENDIPEERRDSGEICLWNCLTGEKIAVTSATAQNVFEVAWHPSQPCFIAATSPVMVDKDESVRTQIRVFRPADPPPDEEHPRLSFTAVKVLDCAAVDINELTIKPNSFSYCYVTAGCTDGNVYVWDTARGDKPIHILRHGRPVEELEGDREREDTGVKFTAWGTSLDRFYTGSSDGVVKVWNIRSPRRPLLRDVLEVPAPVSCGMFSPDRSRLIIGDASGRVFLLSVDNDSHEASFAKIRVPSHSAGSRLKTVRRPTPMTPHPEPPPPAVDALGRPIQKDLHPGNAYLESRQVVLHPNPTIGAIQGPNYASTGLFRAEFHADSDPRQPLLAIWESQQQDELKSFSTRTRTGRRLRNLLDNVPGLEERHAGNVAKDLDIEKLSLSTRTELSRAGAIFDDCNVDYGVIYEEMPLERGF